MEWIDHFQYGFRPWQRFAGVVRFIGIARWFRWRLIAANEEKTQKYIHLFHERTLEKITWVCLAILRHHLRHPVPMYHFDRKLTILFDVIESNPYDALKSKQKNIENRVWMREPAHTYSQIQFLFPLLSHVSISMTFVWMSHQLELSLCRVAAEMDEHWPWDVFVAMLNE